MIFDLASGQAGELGCISEEVSQTLNRNNGGLHYVADIERYGGGQMSVEKEELSPTLQREHHHAVATSIVRRLTPTECERLMGFPDGWTFIPVKTFKSKPRSKRFEKYPEMFRKNPDRTWSEMAADSHRYKACGNSMCVNCMEWIGQRIELVERMEK